MEQEHAHLPACQDKQARCSKIHFAREKLIKKKKNQTWDSNTMFSYSEI